MPLQQDTLLLGGHGVEVFGRADLVTPDKSSQWFSKITVFRDERLIARIERKALETSAVVKHDALNSLFLSVMDETGENKVSTIGSYLNGNVLVERDGVQLGQVPREVVTVSFDGFKFSVAPQVAKKFSDTRKALKYAHLDMEFHDITGSQAGIIAELYGLVPMSSKTADMVRSITTSE